MKLTVRGRPLTSKRVAHRLGLFTQRLNKNMQRTALETGPKSVVFILGCQRSGTTLLSQLLSEDPASDVYPERSALSRKDDPEKLRLMDLPQLKTAIEQNRAGLVVAKPLVESQNCLDLLATDPEWKAVWMFRDYRDVVLSNQGMFGADNGLRDIKLMLAEQPDWRNQNISRKERDTIARLFAIRRRNDAAALFWYSRNQHFFRQALAENNRVWLCDYASLVSDPGAEMERIYQFLGREPASGHIDTKMVHQTSIGRGKDIDLSDEVVSMCDETLGALQAARAAKLASTVAEPAIQP